MKPIRLLMLAVVILLGAGYAFRNPLLKGRLEKALSEQTGFGVELGRLHVGWNLSSFEVAGARLLNPPDFPLRDALDLRTVRAVVVPRSLFTREIQFREVVLDVARLVVVRKADGESNAERLGGARRSGGRAPAPRPEPAPAPTEPAEPGEPRGFRIDRLVLKVGAVEMHDFTKAQEGGEPAVTSMNLNLEQEHRDVTSVQQLGGLVLGSAVQQMGLFLIGQELQDGDSKLNQKIQKAADKLQKKMNQLFGTPQE
jgi:uncharacterized protein involved in outer membrane biogenesis